MAGKVLFSRGAINKLISTDNSTLFDHKSIGLTDRELTVAQLMADGWSNSQIAAELSLAEQTVRNKVTRIYAKIGVSSRTEFLLWAHEQAPSES